MEKKIHFILKSLGGNLNSEKIKRRERKEDS
jgi:hypothetical protein